MIPMKQQTFTDMEYCNRKRKNKQEEFFEDMARLIPWYYWAEIIRPYYHSGNRGPDHGELKLCFRMYLMQKWFNLSDAGIEDAIYDSYAMRSFFLYRFQVTTGSRCHRSVEIPSSYGRT